MINCILCKKYTKCHLHCEIPKCIHGLDSMFVITKYDDVWGFVKSQDYFCSGCRTLVMSVAGYKTYGMKKAKEQRRNEKIKQQLERKEQAKLEALV